MRTSILMALPFLFGPFTDCTSCNSSGNGPTDVHLSVALTDAPSDAIASAVVDIGAITLTPTGGAPIVVTSDGGEHDLISLSDGITADLATLDIPPGEYHHVRLVVESATVTLANGYAFRDGTTERALQIPSGASSGIQVNLGYANGASGVQLTPGETLLVIDFDVSQNFVLNGNPNTPAGIDDVLFTPLLRATVADIAGTIAGTVTYDDGNPFEGAYVTADLLSSPAPEPLQTTTATAITDTAGAYKIYFLSPGVFDVSVHEEVDPLSEALASDEIELADAQDLTDIDFSVPVPAN